MGPRREVFSFEEHMVVGEMTRRILADLSMIAMAGHDAYGQAFYNKVMKIEKAMQDLRNDLDDKVCGEYPRDVDAVEGVRLVNVYYGEREDVPDVDKAGGFSSDFRSRLRALAGLAEQTPDERKAGRPRALDGAKIAEARTRLAEGKSINDIAAEMKVAASTLYRYLR